MTGLELHFEREFEFAPVIVWDALVDPVLVSGWLAEANIEPRVGGLYTLRWMTRPDQPISFGSITELRRPELLVLARENVGTLTFELTEIEGGGRGTSTRLRLTVSASIEPAFARRVSADWMTALDQLDDLLHGHPVNWATWEQDRQEAWTRHLRAGGDSTA